MKNVAAALLTVFALAPAWAQQAPPAQAPPVPPVPPGSASAQSEALAPRPLPLREAAVRTLENNLDIAVSHIDPLVNEQFVTEANAKFDISLDGSLSYGRTQREPSSAIAASNQKTGTLDVQLSKLTRHGGNYFVGWQYRDDVTSYPVDAASLGFVPHTASSTLRIGFAQSLLRNYGVAINEVAIETAANNLKISQQTLRTRILDTLETVETSYWGLVGARRQLDVARSSLDLAKDFLRQTKIRVDVGTLPPIEITTAEAEVASREEAVIVAENTIRNAEDTLRALMRVPQDSPEWSRPILPTDEPGFSATSIDTDQAIATALARRPELESARIAVQNARLNASFRENQVKPDLTVNAVYTQSGNNYDLNDSFLVEVPCREGQTGPCFQDVLRDEGRFRPLRENVSSRDNNSWTIGAVFSYPIGNRAAKAAYTRARLGVDQTNLQLESAAQGIRVEVRTAARDLETAARRVATTRANVVLQRKKLEAEQKRYENGLSTAFQVLTFQNDLKNAESAEINAIVDYNKALAHLSRVKGTLPEDRGIKM